MDPQAAPRGSLVEYARTRIKRAVYEGTFQPGARLRESEICEWLDISRTPVREAMMQLVAEGLLAVLPSRGIVVNQLDRQQVIELYAMRANLEGLAGQLAAQFMSDSDVRFLEDLVSREAKLESDLDKLNSINQLLHDAIHASSHNRYLISTLSSLQNSIALLRGTTLSMPGRAAEVNAEHRAIVEAIRKRDPEAARKRSEEHIRSAEKARLQMLFEDLGSSTMPAAGAGG